MKNFILNGFLAKAYGVVLVSKIKLDVWSAVWSASCAESANRSAFRSATRSVLSLIPFQVLWYLCVFLRHSVRILFCEDWPTGWRDWLETKGRCTLLPGSQQQRGSQIVHVHAKCTQEFCSVVFWRVYILTPVTLIWLRDLISNIIRVCSFI